MKIFGFGKDTQRQRYTALDDDELNQVLEAIKEILSIDNKNKQLEKLDFLLDQLIEQLSDNVNIYEEDEEDEIEQAKSEIKDAFDEIISIERKIEQKDFEIYDIENLEETLKYLGEHWSKKVKIHMNEEIEKISEKAIQIIDGSKIKFYKLSIERSLIDTIHNVSSVGRILDELKEAEDYLLNMQLLDDKLRKMLRDSRERVVWYRAQKKIDEGEVAKGGKNFKKAEKLIGEAGVLLKQDWIKVFPNETPPSLD